MPRTQLKKYRAEERHFWESWILLTDFDRRKGKKVRKQSTSVRSQPESKPWMWKFGGFGMEMVALNNSSEHHNSQLLPDCAFVQQCSLQDLSSAFGWSAHLVHCQCKTTLNLFEHSVNSYWEWLLKIVDLWQLVLFFDSTIFHENSNSLRYSYHQ